MRNIVLLILLLSFLGCTQTITSPDFLNLGFDETIPGSEEVPYGWYYHPKGGYTLKLVSNSQGGKLMYIHCNKGYQPEDSLITGKFHTDLPAELVKGKEVEIRCKIKTKAVTKYAGLFIEARDSTFKELIRLVPTEETGVRATKNWQEISLKTTFGNDVRYICFGGMLYERGSAWFDDFEVYIDGKRLANNTSILKEPTAKEVEWLRQYAYPIKTLSPDTTDDSDLALIGEGIGNAPMVILGEPVNGAGEIQSVKHRVAKYLADHKGFSHISMDATISQASMLNNYVGKGIGEKHNVARRTLFNASQELSDFIQWARKCSEDGRPIRFSGHNSSFLAQPPMDIFRDSFKDFPDVLRTIEILEIEYRKVIDNRLWGMLSEDEINGFFMLASPLYEAILNIKDKEYQYVMLHYYRMFEQAITCKRSDMLNLLSFVTENMLWEHRHKGGKTVLWSDSWGVGNEKDMLLNSLADSLSCAIPSIGFAFGKGSLKNAFRDIRNNKDEESKRVMDAFPGSFEYYFGQLGESAVIIDLRSAKEDPSPQGEWLRKRLFFRKISYNINIQQTVIKFSETPLVDDYDFLIYFDQVSPAKPL